MDLYEIDRIAVAGRSWVHRLSATVKLLALLAIIITVLAIPSLPLHAAIALGVLLLAVSARVPMPTMLGLTGYPLLFLAVIFISIEQLTVMMVVVMTVRVLAITASVILLILTTSFPALFGALGRVLPDAFVAALFFTYRAFFILSTCIINVRTAIHLRGGMSWRRPLRSLTTLGRALAHVLGHAIETSQRVAENLTVRGYNNRIYYLGRK